MMTASLRRVDPGPGAFDPRTLRRQFPIFANNPDLVFLDSSASAQKPRAVIDRIADKKIVHKNLASRTKSRLAQAIKAMA